MIGRQVKICTGFTQSIQILRKKIKKIYCPMTVIYGFAGIMSSTLLSIGKSPVLQESRLAGKFCIDGGFQVCCLSINIHGVSEIIKKYGSDVIEITGTLRNLYTHVFRAVSVET